MRRFDGRNANLLDDRLEPLWGWVVEQGQLDVVSPAEVERFCRRNPTIVIK